MEKRQNERQDRSGGIRSGVWRRYGKEVPLIWTCAFIGILPCQSSPACKFGGTEEGR